MDFNIDGNTLATTAADAQIRIFDEKTKELVHTYKRAGWNTKGHSNRVFGCHFSKFDNNVLITGGWDRTICLWDIRTRKNIMQLFGPNICGDAITSTQD